MNNLINQTVILGGGFTGLFTALHLAHKKYNYPIILIDANERFCFKPLLYEYLSGEMESNKVLPRYEELLENSGVTFVQEIVKEIDLNQREVKLSAGYKYPYKNLVIALGSVTGYFGVTGAKENALPFWSQQDVVAIKNRLRECLFKALKTQDPEERQKLLTVVIVGGGPSGVEMSATLADLVPNWYAALGGNFKEIRVVLLNHGKQILENEKNLHLRQTAEDQLKNRAVNISMLLNAKVIEVQPDHVKYQLNDKTEILPSGTTVWTTGTSTHPLIKNLAIKKENRDSHERLFVTPTLQLPDFPEVFAGGDCTTIKDSNLPPTAQVAYQQGAAIANNLIAIARKEKPTPAEVNLRGTLLKLGLDNAAANIYNLLQIDGNIGHLIRQATYLELLPTPLHNFKATTDWLKDEVFYEHLAHGEKSKNPLTSMEENGGDNSSLIGKNLLQLLLED